MRILIVVHGKHWDKNGQRFSRIVRPLDAAGIEVGLNANLADRDPEL